MNINSVGHFNLCQFLWPFFICCLCVMNRSSLREMSPIIKHDSLLSDSLGRLSQLTKPHFSPTTVFMRRQLHDEYYYHIREICGGQI